MLPVEVREDVRIAQLPHADRGAAKRLLNRQVRNRSADHALLYVTKYLTKYPKDGFPDWILQHDRRIRWVGASKSVGPVVSDREKTASDVETSAVEEQESLPRAHRSLAVRMSECGELVSFFKHDSPDPAEPPRFFGRLPRELLEAAYPRLLGAPAEPASEPPYLIGGWASFAELMNHLLDLAYRPGRRFDMPWSRHDRYVRRRGAEYITKREPIPR